MARLFEGMMRLHLEKVTNASDLGEIVNLEILNWHQLMVLSVEVGQSTRARPVQADPRQRHPVVRLRRGAADPVAWHRDADHQRPTAGAERDRVGHRPRTADLERSDRWAEARGRKFRWPTS